jgi:hypothetical protein
MNFSVAAAAWAIDGRGRHVDASIAALVTASISRRFIFPSPIALQRTLGLTEENASWHAE